MQLGYRVSKKEEVGLYRADLVQISYWKRFGPDLKEIKETAARCRDGGIPFVIHPVFTMLSETNPAKRDENLEELLLLAELADLGLIVHDEVRPDGARLPEERLNAYRQTLAQLRAHCPVSIENAGNTADIDWFWNQFDGDVTVDLGHFESSGIHSVSKMESLPPELIDRVNYVHIHRKNGDHGGILDHWPITETCAELAALEVLVKRKPGLAAILEVNEMEEVGGNLRMLAALRDRLSESPST